MERQTKHRILGILVIIGLVIILLPLFQSNKELSTEAALVQPPPFPDQPVQITTSLPEPEAASAAMNPPQPAATQPDDVIAQQKSPADTAGNDSVQVQLTHNDVIQSEMTATKSDVSETSTTTSPDPVKTSNYRIIEGDKAASILKKSAHNNKHVHNLKTHTLAATIKTPIKTLASTSETETLDDDGLIKLKSAVWVIQIGSFKNKTNALRIVNKLRANGYRAFIQQISTALGDNTRVFVGPEHKRTTARELADRLQSEMHIDGIVISYKPLTL